MTAYPQSPELKLQSQGEAPWGFDVVVAESSPPNLNNNKNINGTKQQTNIS